MLDQEIPDHSLQFDWTQRVNIHHFWAISMWDDLAVHHSNSKFSEVLISMDLRAGRASTSDMTSGQGAN